MPVTNDNEFREWLRHQPKEVCVAIAYRAAMRVLPFAVLAQDDREIWSDLALAVFRAGLVSGVAAVVPGADIEAAASGAASAGSALIARNGQIAAAPGEAGIAGIAAYIAADAVFAAAVAAGRTGMGADVFAAADSAADAATFATANAAAEDGVRASCYADIDVPPEQLMAEPLTDAHEIDVAITRARTASRSALFLGQSSESPWAFWKNWYDGAVAGYPLRWDLQRRIALIPSKIWKAGPEAVAEEIARIEAEYLAEHLPQAEEVVAREDGRFDVRPSVTADNSLIERIFKQTEFALELSLNTNCGFSEMCVGFKLLRYTLDSLRDDPNSVEQHFRMARDVIAKKIASKDYDDHDALTVLVESLNQHALELRGQHSEVRAAYEVRVQQTLREIDDETRVGVAEAMREFQREKATGRLYEETGLDAETVEGGAAVEAQASAIQRTGGRAAVARGLERASQAAKNVDASGGYKATRIGTTGYTIVDMLLKVFGG